MVSLLALWLPILLSAVFVFAASSLIHMLLDYHHKDWAPLPNEEGIADALRPFAVPAGEYMIPWAKDMKAARAPEFVERWRRGPVAMITVLPSGEMSMGKSLGLWFVYSLVISAFAGYIASRALGEGADYLAVFRFAGTTSFLAYTAAYWQISIWYHRSLGTTLRYTLDGLIYGLVTAGVFGWLWP